MKINDIYEFVIKIFKNPTITFVIGVIFTALITYIFTFIKERYLLKEKINFNLSTELNKKIYECLLHNGSIFINQIKTDFSSYKMNMSTIKNINKIVKNNNADRIYEINNELLEKKKILLNNISKLQQLIIDIILYIESNYIALNRFSDFKTELLQISNCITNERDELTNFLYFETNAWEESLNDSQFEQIDNKINILNNNFEKNKIRIIACLVDFQIQIQNEYFSKYYYRGLRKYKMVPRKPLEGKVITIKKPSSRLLNIFK